ncbi:MAG: Lrp/AsnC ligand binding domain-containing protein [Armatimonadota bacterium]|nr:Lrp/AsnC ligand binding domain-containing protein [Armatimonadota bacterium]
MELVRALVLMNVQRGQVPKTAKQLADMDEVVDVYSVAGEYDLVAIIQTEEYERLAEVVTEKLQSLDTILRTTTLMAFRSYKFSS